MRRLTKTERLAFLSKHTYCKCGKVATQVHHIKMIQDGGGNEETNLQALCYQCHQDADHAKCVARMVFTMDGEGGLHLTEGDDD